MKNECAGGVIKEVICLRPKMYSIVEETGKITKKAKGVKKIVVKKDIKHEHYKSALFENQSFRHDMNVLRSVKHKIYGKKLNKLSISSYDSKRWISDNGIDTFAYGHKTLSGGN